jgi:DNA gyrase/topoisomerase IV subunit A
MIKKLTDVENTVSNAFTGAGQNYKLALSKGLSSLGVKISDRATDTEIADAISAQVVQQIAKVFPGSQSNKELEQLLKSKFNLQQELPTILRLVGSIKDEMLAQTKTYEQMANLPDNERTNFNAKLAQGKNYQKIQQYRNYENKYRSGNITLEERQAADKLKQELGL